MPADRNAGSPSADFPEAAAHPAPPRRALLLVNRHAGNGECDLTEVTAALRSGGMDVEAHVFPKKHAMPDVIRERAGDVHCIVIGGGDGTLNAAAEAVVDSGRPLGILPLGTANDLARTLGIPADPVSAARVILNGTTRTLDLGVANGHLFWNVASVGFATDLADALSTGMKKRWGVLAYALATVRRLAGLRRFSADLAYDGRVERVRTLQVSVGNGRHHGGGLTVAWEAEPDDGLLHVYSLEPRHWLELLAVLPALRRGKQAEWRGVRSFACTELEVRTGKPLAVNTDGGIATATPVRFQVRPGAVAVYVPSPSS
ncbi:lipid kinase [Azospirillum rugosum]|uniref:YegS/Rv2252/BmrU family lipid kinase n=1 Tax=Azospirillum rugosum TaxID=416170 RepID=A0ABS4SSG2_9PROT|nr:lipid kinase [Azospirillum rugosum]MBP2295043.1 YegS/Rv2252/BmrU family lipid kinase [Azospirillum rugosum]MDQ0528866.1 YegS/Rv2252/BmrU family lipid kinase [Azospirillum rugosum]